MLDPKESFDYLKKQTLAAIETHFPLKGRVQTVHLKKLEVLDNVDHDDIRAQHDAKVNGTSFSVPVYAHMDLIDNATGKVVNSDRVRIAELPKMTNRFSFIVDGQEHQVDNQWQLKSGVYARRKQNGELEAQFNTSHPQQMRMILDPATKQLTMRYGKANLPVYPLLKAFGITDEQAEKYVGKDVLEANKKARGLEGTLQKFYKTDTRTDAKSTEEAARHFVNVMSQAKMHPDVNELTLGKPLTNVDGEAFLLAAKKIIAVQGGQPEDDRDSLVFKSLRSVGDYAHDYVKLSKVPIKKLVDRKLNTAGKVRDVVKFDLFNRPVKSTFTKNVASRFATQINPVEMIGAATQTTILGPGGIQSEQAIVDEAKFVNPSHMGFLDPIHTPEGSKTGVTLRLPVGVKKRGNDVLLPVYNIKTGQAEEISPLTFVKSNVVMPDQVSWKDGHPAPLHPEVMMAGAGNKPKQGKWGEAQYVLKHANQLFSTTTNLIPFINNTSGNRASMAGRQMEQAISLIHREEPLVHSGTGVHREDIDSFEKVMGKSVAHVSPIDGKVVKVTQDNVQLHDANGKLHTVHIYNNYPLNDAKGMLHSTPLVKVGDKVSAGQVVADNNFTKNGTLAFGNNLRVAFMPYKGLNFEDGIVISETAAKKLSSEHLHKEDHSLTPETVVDKKRYLIHHPQVFKQDQLHHIDDTGVAKVGTKVKPGDPLILSMQPFEIKDRTGMMAFRKAIMGTHNDTALKWTSDVEGEVVAVHRTPESIKVHVKTIEPMQVGDKMCYDAETEILTVDGWKSVTDVTLDDTICSLVDGKITYQKPIQVHHYDRGGRMYRIKSQQVDLFVTEQHMMYVKRRNDEAYGLHPAKTIAGERVRYSKAGEWVGTPQKEVVLPSIDVLAGQHGHGSRAIAELRLPTATYCMLLGAFLSNGHVVNQPGNYGISIDKATGAEFEKLCRALKSAGFVFSQTVNGNCSRVTLYSKQLMLHFKQFGHAADKFIPNEVLLYPRETLSVLLEWLLWGDGSQQNGKFTSYTTISKRLADDVQRLALHVGIAANVKVLHEAGWQRIRGRNHWCQTMYSVRLVSTKLTPQVNHGHTKKQYVQEELFEDDYSGSVHCVTVPGHIVYVRRNGIPVWSGNSGRYGNKGIVSRILPDHEMPHTADKKPIEVVLNPAGIGSRMNVGQVLETAASKIAEKTGKPYIAPSFNTEKDMIEHVQKELKAHGLTDKEHIIDPVTQQPMGEALVGKQYMLKHVHQVEKKGAATSGMTLPGQPSSGGYDINLQPTTGQRFGTLGMYTLLAHGAIANIREAQTLKGEGPDPNTSESKKWPSLHTKAWVALQTGGPLPTPKPTFAFKKFEDMLKGSGVNIEKKGHEFILTPLTEKHVQELAQGRYLTKPAELLEAKVDKSTGELKPRAGGLFDEKLTGGHGGKQWSAIKLAEPVPNPVFLKPILALTGLKGKEFDGIVDGTMGVDMHGKVVDNKGRQHLSGGNAIEHLLKKIDVDTSLKAAQTQLAKAKPADVDNALKKVKYLTALQQLKLKPHEAYIFKSMPILPPAMRPASIMQDGNIKYADINKLYREFALVNEKLQDPVMNKFPEHTAKLRKDLYDYTQAITGYGIPYDTNEQKGLLHQIAGAQPKRGFFQQNVTQKRQDMSMRTTIIPDPALGLDEAGIPKKLALETFTPLVVNRLQKMGLAKNPLEAQQLIAKKTPAVYTALGKVMEDNPVLLKRDPALWQYSIQGFKPKLVEGGAIKIHPLVCGGYNADFDGDSVLGEILVAINEEVGDKGSGGFTMPHIGNIATLRVMNLEKFPRIESSRTINARGVEEFDVPEGVYVPAHTPTGAKMHKVTKYSIHPNCAEWKVITRRERVLFCSEEHSLAILDPVTLEVRKASPKDAVGLCIPTLRNITGKALVSSLEGATIANTRRAIAMVGDVPLNFEVGWMIGATIGDGWVSNTRHKLKDSPRRIKDESESESAAVCIAYGKDGEEVASHWKEVVGKYAQNTNFTEATLPHVFEGKACESKRVTLSSSSFAKWLSPLIGKLAGGKHLPPDFLCYPLECRQGLLCGLIDTDGTVNKVKAKAKDQPQYQMSYTTISSELADGIQLLALSVGIVTSRTEYVKRDSHVYLVTFSGRCVQEADWLKLSHARKSAVLCEFQAQSKVDHARHEIVPLPDSIKEEILTLLRTAGATKKSRDSRGDRAFSVYTVLGRATGVVTRTTLDNMLEFLDGELSPHMHYWLSLVMNPEIGWDQIEKAEATGEVKTMYDLTVPDSWTFTMADGAIVWDTMSVYVPITQDAKQEAIRMRPSNNIFSEASGNVVYTPTLESALGIYKLGQVGNKLGKEFKHPGHILDAVRKGQLLHTDVVKLNGKETTAGRIMLTTALPEAMHSNVLHNLEQPLDKKGLNAMLTTLGKNHQPEFDKSVNLLKDLGNTASTGVVEMKFHHAHTPAIAREMGVDGHEPLHIAIGGHTLGLEDFTTDKVSREKALQEAKQKIAVIDKMQLSDAEKERRRVEAYIQADVQARKLHEQSGTGKNLYTMHKAGIKPSWDQYKQMVLAPMLVKDSSDKIVSTPITRSYGEGLDVMGYWTQLHGARRGSVMKVQEVQEPGYMSKLLMNSMMDVLVTGTDCGTNKGVSLHIGEKDVHDRILAQDYKAGAVHVPAGTLLTPQVVSDIRAHDKNAQIMVRSPLKCEHDKGVCQKCAGLSSRGADHPVGSNIGVHAAQTIGERAVQLTMKSFHTGGSVEQGGGKLLNAFSRFQQLTMLPKKIPDSAALANNTGTVSHIEDVGTGVNVTINGHKHFVGKDTTGNPLHLPLPGSKTDWKGLHVGMHVNAGQHLSDPSRTYVNPHDLYKATKSIDAVQNHIVGEIYDLYKDEGIKRRHVETAVRAMSNLTKVTNPGDAHDILHGEFKPLMAVQRMNQELLRDGKKPIVHTPVLKGVNMLPFDAQEDWMAKLQHQKLRTSIADSAAIGAKSNIHGMHPIPAIAYGAEIGLNESHSNTPGLEHLKNVKKSLY